MALTASSQDRSSPAAQHSQGSQARYDRASEMPPPLRHPSSRVLRTTSHFTSPPAQNNQSLSFSPCSEQPTLQVTSRYPFASSPSPARIASSRREAPPRICPSHRQHRWHRAGARTNSQPRLAADQKRHKHSHTSTRVRNNSRLISVTRDKGVDIISLYFATAQNSTKSH